MSGNYAQPGRPYVRPTLPLGVALLAILIGLFGLLLLIAGLLVVIASSFSLYLAPTSVLGLTGDLAGGIILFLGVILLLVATGLWHLEMWALALSLLVVGFFLLIDVLAGTITLGLVIAAALFVYLLAVHRHFT